MSDAEIDKAVKEAAAFEAQDKKRKEGVDAKNEADSMVFQVENALKEAGDKLDGADKAAVESDLTNLKALVEKHRNNANLSDADVNELKSAKEKLMNSAQKLFAKMYEQAQAQQGPQGGPQPGPQYGGNAGGNAGDDVVDADYTEV
jgi:molecular chaperone DnaK